MAVLLMAGGVWAEHGGTQGFEARNRALREEVAGLVKNERLKVLWGEGAVFYQRQGEEGWVKVGLEDGKREVVGEKPESAKGAQREDRRRGRPRDGQERSGKSPDGAWRVEVKDGKVMLQMAEGEDGPTVLEIPRPEGWVLDGGVLWSPKADRFVVWRRPNHPLRQVHYVRSSPKDSVQPEHFTNTYPKAGDELNVARPVVCFVDGREPVVLEEGLVEHPYDIRRSRWREDGTRLSLEFVERGFGICRVLEVDSEARSQRVVVEEKSETFIYVDGKAYRHDLKDGAEVLWLSERDGWNHLYLMDGATGEVKRQVTKGEWVVRKVRGVDEEKREVLVEIGGYHAGQDPYYIHWARVGIDDGKMTLLTAGDGTHELAFSPDGGYYVDRYSRVDLPPVHELRRVADGSLVAELERGDAGALLETGWQMPERFVAKDRNGKFDIHGIILRPRGFEAGKKYAVVEQIYAGPHDSFVPKGWSTWYGSRSEVCEAGFIVVQIDGLGTSNRCREFHEVAYKNLMDSGFPDRVKWMKAAGAKYPEMDLARVGIYGGSAGGQSTLAGLLTHGDFYKAGVADCGCHDNRMDKLWWNEQWMDWPVDESYAANSNVTHVGKLQGKLMLTVGEVDTNVDPSSTLQVVDALLKADKDFEFYIVPNGGHGVGESAYLKRKRVEFFERWLGE